MGLMINVNFDSAKTARYKAVSHTGISRHLRSDQIDDLHRFVLFCIFMIQTGTQLAKRPRRLDLWFLTDSIGHRKSIDRA